MGFWTGAGSGLIGGLASIYSAWQSSEAQESANQTNQNIALMNNQTAIDLANTSHQREVKDLVAAGLNPVLSVDGAGSPVPALTSAKVEATSPKFDLGKAVNNALTARQAAIETDARQEQLDLIKKQVEGQDFENLIKKGEAFDAALTSDAWHNMDTAERQEVIRHRIKAIKESARNDTNLNWRNNLKAFTPLINTASKLMMLK